MTVNLNHVANQVTTTGSASDLDLNVTTKGNGNLVFQTANTTQFRVTPQSAAVNYFQVKGSASTERPILSVTGSDTNIGLVLQTKNTGSVTAQNDGGYPAVVLNTSTSGQTVTMSAYGIVVSGFNTDIPYDISSKGKSEVSLSTQYGTHLKVGRTDSATNSIINYVQISGSFSGNPVSINALGSDTNIPVYYYSKGTGKHFFYSSTTTANPQFSISPTASPVNYLQVAAGTGFNEPTLSVISGSWADVDLGLVPLGTGMVKTSGTGIKLSGSSSGYVGLKGAAAAGSTTYTLPAADGTSGQVLSTNGSATLSWANPGSSSGPAFEAIADGTQVINSGAYTKVLFPTENFDTNNNFASSRFTPTVAGYYYITGASAFSTTGETVLAPYKNGSLYRYLWDNNMTTTYGFTVSVLMYLNGTTDYVEFYLYQSSGSAKSPTSNNSFSGFLARAA